MIMELSLAQFAIYMHMCAAAKLLLYASEYISASGMSAIVTLVALFILQSYQNAVLVDQEQWGTISVDCGATAAFYFEELWRI